MYHGFRGDLNFSNKFNIYIYFFVSENAILAHGAAIGYSHALTLSDQVISFFFFVSSVSHLLSF